MQLSLSPWLLFILAIFISWGLTGIYRRWAQSNNWLDIPNHRSSHTTAIPGSAGTILLFLYASTLAINIATSSLSVTKEQLLWSYPVLMGVIGIIDDRFDVSSKLRFIGYSIILMAALAVLWPLPALTAFGVTLANHYLLFALTLLVLLWLVNLYNFMDGINGLAGFQALFICGSIIYLSNSTLAGLPLTLLIVISGTVIGFLYWNFPVAKVFMGDSGSIFIGCWIGLLALKSDLTPWCWMILMATFVTDTSYTLLVRMAQGDRWREAHSVHAYQILARQLHSHSKVVAVYMLINILWLLPLAYLATQQPSHALAYCLLAYLPLLAACYKLRAGLADR